MKSKRGATLPAVRGITPVVVVDAIEPSVEFWSRLGFHTGATAPEGDRLAFAILEREGVQLMYQTRASIASDVPSVASEQRGNLLFVVVDDLSGIADAVRGAEVVLPRRRTFYGMDEIGVLEPGGHVLIFAQPVDEQG